MGRSSLRIWLSRGATALAVLLLAIGLYLWQPVPGLPDLSPYEKAAQQYNVEILRDTWGVPHIYGKRDEDTAFGIAYAHAEDDYRTIETTVIASRGRLAFYDGKDAAVTDYLVGLIDVWGTVERVWPKLDPQVKALATGYADGLNLYAAKHVDQVRGGVLPYTGQDVVASFILKTPFFYGFDKQLMELFEPTRQHEIALVPTNDNAFHQQTRTDAELGSNGFAVARKRSDDAKSRLVINSHQPYKGPVAWYEAHLNSEEGWNMYGALFPVMPVIAHGFNENLGWANTVNKPDLADIYVLTRNPENDSQYELDDEWLDFEEVELSIPVRLFGPFVWNASRTILRSVHGPVVETDHGTYALRFAGLGEGRQLAQYYAINKARTFEQWQDAMALQYLPSINYVYADRENNIAFVHNGQYPNRKAGLDWGKYIPGNRSDLIWKKYLPWDDVPKLINPDSGFIFNANNTPFTATDGPDNLRPENFPETMGLRTEETNRSLRVTELAPQYKSISAVDLARIKFDKSYSTRSATANAVQVILGLDLDDQDLKKAAEHLANWNLSMDVDNVHAGLGHLATYKWAKAKGDGDPLPDLKVELKAAVDFLMDHYGQLDVPWGTISRIKRGKEDYPLSGGPDILRAAYYDQGDDGKLYGNAGDTWISFVEWDENGKQSAKVIHQYGSATLDENSRHFGDQTPLFAQEQFRPVLMSRHDVELSVERQYRPGEE